MFLGDLTMTRMHVFQTYLTWCALYAALVLLSCGNRRELEVGSGSTFNQQLINNGHGRKEKGLNIGKWVYNNPHSIDTIEWCIDSNNINATRNSIMCDWQIQDCIGCLFWAISADGKESIVILDSIEHGGMKSLDGYASKAMAYVKENIVEGVTFEPGRWWKAYDVDGSHSYFSICPAVKEDRVYIYYMFYWYSNGHIYDITYRYSALNKRLNHDIVFWEFIYNFKHGDYYIVDKDSFRIARFEEV